MKFPWPEAGVAGRDGAHAQTHAASEPEPGLGHVTTDKMAAPAVPDLAPKARFTDIYIKIAIHKCVQAHRVS